MKRLLFINNNIYTDSTFFPFYKELSKYFKIKIIYPKKIKSSLGFGETSKDLSIYNSENIDYEAIDLISSSIPFLKNLYNPFKLRKAIKKFNPNSIHAQFEVFSPTLTQIIILGKSIFENIKIFSIALENVNRMRFPYNFFGRYNAKNIYKIICLNNDSINETKCFGVKETDLIKVDGVVDDKLFDFQKHSIEGKSQFNLGYFGRILEEKGIQTILKVLKNNKNYILSIVGTGVFENKLKEISKEDKIEDQVNFFGKLDKEEIKERLKSIDVLIVPSLSTPKRKEQFGRVIVEGMYSGVPIIGSSSGAIPEVINNYGLIFKEGDDLNLELKIKQLFADHEKYLEISESANNYSRSAFSIKKGVENYKKIYEL